MKIRSLLLTLLLAGCGLSPAEQRLAESYRALAERVAEHADLTSATDDPTSITGETDAYCTDMAERSDDMEAACDDMMGRMHDEDRDRLLLALDGLRGEVDRHCAAMEVDGDAATMHEECDAHDATMDEHLEAVAREVPDAEDEGGVCPCC